MCLPEKGLRWLGAALLCLAGCRSSGPELRPPPAPEEFNMPPADDPRFSGPPIYPKGTLNQGLLKRDKDRDENGPDGPPRGLPRMGAGAGGGGY
jgi:hypothetical protein